jgi:hypothetical protein
MAAPTKKAPKNGVLIIRPRGTIPLPIGLLGYHHLLEPDEAFNTKKFDACVHLNPAAVGKLAEVIQKNAIDANLGKLQEEAGNVKLPTPVSAEDWVADRLKEPKEGFWTSLPFMQVSSKFRMLKRKDGTEYPLTMKAWDAKNKMLDLAALNLGKESLVELIVYANLVFSPEKKVEGVTIPASVKPNLQLAGVRIHKLVRWTGSGPATTDDDDIKAILGEDYAADDLSAFTHMEKTTAPAADGDDHGDVEEMF